jgi:hypothetical protein
MPLTVAFALLQTPLLLRYEVKADEDGTERSERSSG